MAQLLRLQPGWGRRAAQGKAPPVRSEKRSLSSSWRHQAWCAGASAIDIAAMAYAHHQDHQFAALPFVDDAVVAHTQLVEDGHRYAQRNGVQVLALLRTLALNLLRYNGFQSIRAGLMAMAHDNSRMLGWVGIFLAETG